MFLDADSGQPCRPAGFAVRSHRPGPTERRPPLPLPPHPQGGRHGISRQSARQGEGERVPRARREQPGRPATGKSRAELEAFAGKVSDKLEFIPTEKAVYCFVGKPPDAFGIVWWSDGQEHNFKTLMKAKGLTQMRVQLLSDALRDSYKKHREDARFSTTFAGRKVTVTPSDVFAADVEKIIHEVE